MLRFRTIENARYWAHLNADGSFSYLNAERDHRTAVWFPAYDYFLIAPAEAFNAETATLIRQVSNLLES